MAIGGAACLLLALCCLRAEAAEHRKPVRGETLNAIFADAEYGDGVHYAYRFRRDGTFSGTEMAQDVRGSGA